jgi:uncharacterized protein YaaQ
MWGRPIEELRIAAMKLVIAIVSTADLDELLHRLAERGYRATIIDQSGGFLKQGNATLLLGVQEALVADALRLIGTCCRARLSFVNPATPMVEPGEFFVSQPVEAHEGGAVCFVLNIERYERIA